MTEHTVPSNGAPDPTYHPDIWSPGDISKRIWDYVLGGYVIWVADPESGEAIRALMDEPEPYEPPSPIVITAPSEPTITIERRGPKAWRIDVGLAEFMFRNVVTHRELNADVTVMAGTTRVIRSTTSLSIAGRNSFAKACVERSMGYGSADLWRNAVYMAFEAVLDQQETLPDAVSLWTYPVTSMAQEFLFEPLWPLGASLLVAPGEIGKSTLARAMAVSITTGREVIPGFLPRITGPVLYVAAEDVQPGAHARSIEAICRGAGLVRGPGNPDILFQPVMGQELHHISATIAEMAGDFAGVILDAQQGLMAVGDAVRNETTTFWNAIDQIGRPVFVVAHPNKVNSQQWQESDGRAAGSEVSRDRPRMTWMMSTRSLPSVAGTYHSVLTLANRKNNDGPRYEEPIHIGRTWSPGQVTFSPSAPPAKATPAARLSKRSAAALETIERLYAEGKRTVTMLQQGDPEGLGKESRRFIEDLLAAVEDKA